MPHQVNAKLRARGVSFWDLEIKVYKDDDLFGTLFVTQDSVDWRPRDKKNTHRMRWEKFDVTMREEPAKR